MPARTSAVVLGFLGSGAASTDSIESLLIDFVAANGGKAKVILPATEEHWTDGLEAVADLAVNQGWPLEVVTDDGSAKFKGVKVYLTKAQKIHKSSDVTQRVVALTSEGKGHLVMFWDEDNDSLYDALEGAVNEGIPVLDICEGLHQIELAEPSPEDGEEAPPEAENTESTGGGDDEVTEEWLASLSDVKIEAMADDLGLKPEEYESWDDVRSAIYALSQGDAGGKGAAEVDLPTDDDVEDWGFPELKQFAVDNEIEVPDNSRSPGYKTAIKAWLETARENAAALEQEEADLQLPPDGEEPLAFNPEWVEEVKNDLGVMLTKMDRVLDGMGNLGMSVDKLIASLNGAAKAEAGEPPPTTTVRRPVAAKKAAPASSAAKASGTTTTGRVAAKKAPSKAAAPAPARAVGKAQGGDSTAPPKTKGEKVMAPVLKFVTAEKVTKAQAQQILELWDQRPKGRPTKREQKLYTLARDIIPLVKRSPGRPRKAATV